ncbi:DL-endopeptidase inhibitor IseA family protein [Paenibacillus tepidiphilus]|uniref:DL-endopeptidase inhibitor IseA family protein n=1 Tax=Paenibacillus tepidiphilus TaxID=2608683 RepID=UPI00123BD49A|nr:DL-endopeptidase inhibitor IseA family protein [Paenibacillus tepidiphilus]
MPRIAQTADELREFIAAAEMAWFDVFDSADDGQVIEENGGEYYRLPLKFSTKAKVIAYFRRYWGADMSSRMFCNLQTVTRNNRLYVIAGDTGTVHFFPLSVAVTGQTATRIRLTAVLAYEENTPEESIRVRYLIAKSGEKLTILNRDHKNEDVRYQDCAQVSVRSRRGIRPLLHKKRIHKPKRSAAARTGRKMRTAYK